MKKDLSTSDIWAMILAFIVTIVFLLLVTWGLKKFILEPLKEWHDNLPQCIEWQEEYYWKSWAGNPQFLGTNDFETARKMAGDRPLMKSKSNCIKYNK